MPAGMQIIGSHGIAQVDSTYRNLSLRLKTTVTTTAVLGSDGPAANVSSTGTISISGIANPVVALRSSALATLWFVDLAAGTMRILASGPVGTSVTAYVFGETTSAGLDYGFQVFNESGELCFDAGRQYMRVVDIITAATVGSTSAYPGGRTYATVVTGGSLYGSQTTGAPPPASYINFFMRFGCSWSGTTMSYNGVCTGASLSGSSHGSSTYNPATLLVLDVTNY